MIIQCWKKSFKFIGEPGVSYGKGAKKSKGGILDAFFPGCQSFERKESIRILNLLHLRADVPGPLYSLPFCM